MIYVRGDDLIDTSGGYGTNAMLGRIADALALFDDYGDETRLFLQRVAGRTIAEFLRSNDGANITLFIDALDESRGYGAPEGVWKLINQIADLTCPIVLTTRREHFDSTFRNLSQALKSDELPASGGSPRNGRLFDLQLWKEKEVDEFINAAIRTANPNEADNLRRFLDSTKTGQAKRYYGDLPSNPLFSSDDT